MNFLRSFDRLSFWLGFLAGSLFWFVVTRIWPYLLTGLSVVRERLQQAGQKVVGDVQVRYRQELLQHVQGLHLAAPLFALDEILIPPRVLLEEIPPLSEEDTTKTSGPDVVSRSVLWAPDWSEMAAYYRQRSASLLEIVADGASLALIAPAGYGKSVALAAVASALARQDPHLGDRRTTFPLWLHAADLDLNAETVADAILSALSTFTSTLTRAQLAGRVREALTAGQATLLLDGLDELPPAAQDQVIGWLERFRQEYPAVQVLVGADSAYFDGLLQLHLAPLTLAAWSQQERERFLAAWARAWETHIAPELSQRETAPPAVDPLLISMWLREGVMRFSPLELTLRTWGALAGDMAGNQPHHALEAHLRRLLPQEHHATLRSLAAAALQQATPAFTSRQAHTWLGEPPEPAPSDEENAPASPALTPTDQALKAALSNGLLLPGANDRLRFVHPSLAGFLAGSLLSPQDADWRWCAVRQALRTAAIQSTTPDWISSALEQARPPLFTPLLTIARWLPDAPPGAGWRAEVLRRLARLLHDPHTALTLRHIAALALSLSGDPGAGTLFRKLLESRDAFARQIAALNLGLLRDRSAATGLSNALLDVDHRVAFAASLALVALGGEAAINAVANLLLHGDEERQRAAAEALANSPREGHPLLQEAITLEEIQAPVRRAAIFGLMRVDAPWAREALERLQYEDDWLVKNTAIQALEELAYRRSHRLEIPAPLPETPWLVEFAAAQGLGVSPGEPAIQLLLRALQSGDEFQRLAAARRLRFLPLEGALPPLYHTLYGTGDLDLRENAWLTLWYQQSGGISLPAPQQFGLG